MTREHGVSLAESVLFREEYHAEMKPEDIILELESYYADMVDLKIEIQSDITTVMNAINKLKTTIGE
tara:strand:+ start:105 stop:305 length:201 start_codon:yes stop_codon:yes gene_type:complete